MVSNGHQKWVEVVGRGQEGSQVAENGRIWPEMSGCCWKWLEMSIVRWRLDIWRLRLGLEIGWRWRLEIGDWRLEIRDWRLEMEIGD